MSSSDPQYSTERPACISLRDSECSAVRIMVSGFDVDPTSPCPSCIFDSQEPRCWSFPRYVDTISSPPLHTSKTSPLHALVIRFQVVVATRLGSPRYRSCSDPISCQWLGGRSGVGSGWKGLQCETDGCGVGMSGRICVDVPMERSAARPGT